MTTQVDQFLMIREMCQELPQGLSLIWNDKHVWPSAYRPESETLTDTIHYSLQAAMGKVKREDDSRNG